MKNSVSIDRKKLLLPALTAVCFVVVYADLILCRKVFTSDSIIWYGSFHYFIDSMSAGSFPFWDPYLTNGTYFYPNVPHHGLLDPLVLPCIAVAAVFGVSPLTLYIHLHVARLVINAAGAWLFFRHLTKSGKSAVLAAGVLMLSLPHSYFKQYGVLDHFYLIPFALHLVLLLFENPYGKRKYLYLAGIMFISAVTMNIYIPVQYTFNIIFFAVGLFLFGIVAPASAARAFRDVRFSAFAVSSLVVAVLMLAPSLQIFRDASSDGELFPMQRIVQKNDAVFKQITASDLNTSNLSNKFTRNQAVFNSWGNVVNLLYPDLLHSFRYWADEDMMSEIDQYIGIVPLAFCLLGLLCFRSRYRYLILMMLVLNFINGYSSYGFMNKPFNFAQEILNAIFPPLQMSQGRETFGYFTIFYMCAFFSMGLAVFFERTDSIGRSAGVLAAICLVIAAAKAAISWLYLRRVLFISFYDMLVVLEIVLLSVLAFMRLKGKIAGKAAFAIVAVVTVADMGLYNEIFKNDVLQDSRPFYSAFRDAAAPKGTFQYFREPIVELPLAGRYIAFEESISRRKGALSLGYNHSLFTTKRYYDLLTNIPLTNQFVLGSMVYPVIGFYPENRTVQADDRKRLMQYYMSADLMKEEPRLFLEDPSKKDVPTEDLGDLERYPDVVRLKPNFMFATVDEFFRNNEELLKKNYENLSGFMEGPGFKIEVADFSVNEAAFRVSTAQDGYFYFNDGWSKYWEAYDNGRKIPVYKANYNSKAVRLSKGGHAVRFVFNPAPYKRALAVYYAGFAIFIFMTLYAAAAVRREKVDAAPEVPAC